MKNKVQLVLRLNQITTEQDELKTKLMELEKERIEIVKEICGRSDLEDIQPKKRVRVKE